jgi:uncharacterized protein
MSNKKFVYIIPLIFLAFTAAIYVYFTNAQQTPENAQQSSLSPPLPETSVTINDTLIFIELANTNQLRELGLSGRDSLPENAGMLFTFTHQRQIPQFWMKDMNFPIDMIWIDNGQIVQITNDVPAPEPDTPDSDLPKYSPNQPIEYVLEVNAGFAEENDINVGDEVEFNF